MSRILHSVVKRLPVIFAAAMMPIAAFAQSAPDETGPAMDHLHALEGQARLDVLEAEARREGRVSIYGAIGIDRAQILTAAFNEAYPGVAVDFVRLSENELVQRVLLEARAGAGSSDLIISNTPWLGLLADALTAYVPTTVADWDERFIQGGREEGWSALVYEVVGTTIAWRTDRVAAEEAPKTLEALAEPKWRGRIGTTTHLERLMAGMFDELGEEPSVALLQKLADQENRLYRSTAALSEALAAGEIDVAWNFSAHRPAGLKASGAPVDYVFQEPLFGLGITASISRNAANPYAAALMTEFLSRAETLEAIDKLEGGRFFGNLEGEYENDIADHPSLVLFKPIPEDEFAALNRRAESMFVRR